MFNPICFFLGFMSLYFLSHLLALSKSYTLEDISLTAFTTLKSHCLEKAYVQPALFRSRYPLSLSFKILHLGMPDHLGAPWALAEARTFVQVC